MHCKSHLYVCKYCGRSIYIEKCYLHDTPTHNSLINRQCTLLALTFDTDVVIVVTVMSANSPVMAVHQSGLRSSTLYIIQKDRTCSLAKL